MQSIRRDRFPSKNVSDQPINRKLTVKPAERSTSSPVIPTKNTVGAKNGKSTGTITCYNCRLSGHISRDCPKPRRPIQCSNCGSNDHTRGRCPSATLPSSAKDNPESFRVDPTVSVPCENPFAKTVTLNRHSVSGLIDSGCSNVLIRESAARKCRAETRLKPSPLYTVGDASQPGSAAIGEATLDVTVDGVIAYDHKVLVVPDHVMPVDVLVGRTWLTLPHVNYYKKDSELIF